MPRDNRGMYMAYVCVYVCCSDCVGVCGNVCCVAAVVKDSVLRLLVLMYVVCLCRGMLDVVFYVCIVTRGAASARVWEVGVFRHANVICWCLVCILWQFLMLHSA